MRFLVRQSLLLALLPVLLAFPQKGTPDVGQTSLEPLSSDAAVLNGAGGETTVKLSAKTDWLIASNTPWLTLSTSSGKKGRHRKFTIVTTPNHTDSIRTGAVTLSSGGETQTIVIRQRPYIFKRELLSEADVRNTINVLSVGTVFTRIYTLLPVPESNLYQDISNWSGSGQRYTCPDGENSYMASDLKEGRIQPHGGEVGSESFHVKSYLVTANLGLIQDIPDYDAKSEVCRRYLGKEDGGYVDPAHPEIAEVADSLWTVSSGELIAYARLCYEWTANNLKYGNNHAGMRTMDFIMRYKISDCGNYASVFISLLRAKGIPARHIVMMNPWSKHTESWQRQHTRAEFYIPAYGWIPVDPTYKSTNPYGDFFGIFTGPNVVMYRGISIVCMDPDRADFSLKEGTQARWWYWYSSGGIGIGFTHQFSLR